VVHRRGGKTVAVVADLCDEALKFDKLDPITGLPLRNPQYAYVAPTRGQAESIAWEYFKEMLRDVPGVKFHSTKLKISFPHPRGTCSIFLLGVENFDNIRGMYLDGYILDEYGDMHPEARDKVLLPMTSDRLGWEIVIGTPKGDNQFKERFDKASESEKEYALLLTVEDTNLIDADELADLKEGMSDEGFAQEYMCRFDAEPEGYYYAKYMKQLQEQGRIGKVPYDPYRPVITFWDLGINDSGVIWFAQEIDRAPHIIDFYETNNEGLDTFVNVLNQKGYTYVKHFLPHDVMVRELTNSGRTRKDYLEGLGVNPIEVVPKSQNLLEDIHAVRVFLRRCWFDGALTAEGIRALKSYSKKWDRRKKVYLNTPDHNWASHAADGFRQMAVTWYSGIGKSLPEIYDDLPESSDGNYDIFNI
jgi:phage terminase large subunit